MAIVAILIDARPRLGRGSLPVPSLLGLPLGPGTIADALRAELRAAEIDRWVIALHGAGGRDHLAAVRTVVPDVTVLDGAGFGAFLDTWESADWLLFVDARRFPCGELGAVLALKSAMGSALAVHLVHPQRGAAGTRERVLCDEHQRIRVIQRLYDGVTNVETAGVGCSLMSVAMARHLQPADLFDLPAMRTRLTTCGVPSHDCTATGATLDLLRCDDLLALNDRTIFTATPEQLRARFVERAPGIWVGARCRIHPRSRIYGPAVLHEEAVIDADAVVIGPTVLGRGAHVERGGLVSQSLVGSQVRVRASTAAVRRVLVASNGNGKHPDDPGVSAERRAASWAAVTASGGAEPPRALLPRSPATVAKRATDFLLALVGLTLLSPLLLITAALVKLTSPGPAFFRDEREGRGGRVFRCWKFRTMVPGAHALQRALYQKNAVDGPQFKLDHDPRVTWLGGWLRKTNIDELPQLFNVLRGEMSLIGPRPSPFRENQICVPWRDARLAVRPGITGLWQICRRDRSAGDFHQWIYFDTLYVRHWSLGLDLRIFLATLLTLGGRWSVPLGWMIRGAGRQPPLADPGRPPLAWPVICGGDSGAQASASAVAVRAR